jgi:coatomer subunit beta'
VFWSDSGALVAIATDASIFILRCDVAAIGRYVAARRETEDGCDDAFEVLYEVSDRSECPHPNA